MLAVLLVLWADPVWAACSGSSPNLVAPTWADVAACHTAAANGDTITVSAGSYTVTANTAITKYVLLIASGTVTLTDNVALPLSNDLLTITESTAGSTKVSGFAFVAGTSTHSNPTGVIRIIATLGGSPVLITNNSYTTSNTGDFIIAQTNQGVIWSNTMTGTPSGGLCIANTCLVRHKPGGDTTSWTRTNSFGGTGNLFVEGNTLVNVFEAIDADDNARTVWRYNSMTNSAGGSHGPDTSGIGVRHMEYYGNTWVYDGSAQATCGGAPANINGWMGLRGGTALIHHNAIPNADSDWGVKSEITFFEEVIDRNAGPFPCWGTITLPDGYPSPRQIGWGYITGGTQAGATGVYQDIEPVLLWGNTGTGNYGSPSVSASGYDQCGAEAPVASTFIQSNRDYYVANASFNGTTGVGEGLLASRPATCTVGVGYWATDQGGNWQTLNGTANDGALYTCTATNTWSLYYTPYTYPHPLSSGVAVAPNAPTNVRIR